MDCSPLCSSVYGILQARILEWVFPGNLPDPGIKHVFLKFLLHQQTWSLPLVSLGKPENQLYLNKRNFENNKNSEPQGEAHAELMLCLCYGFALLPNRKILT